MPAPKGLDKYRIWKERLSLAHRGKPALNKGKKMSDDFKIKMSGISRKFWADPKNQIKIKIRNNKISLSKIGDRNPMKRPEVALKASLSMRGRLMGDKNHSKKSEVRAKISKALNGHLVSEEIRQKISKNLEGKMVGKLNPFYGKQHTQEVKDKSRARAISMMVSGAFSNKRTGIEVKMSSILVKTGLNFMEQVPLEKITIVDFYLPEYRLVIYCDGDFWHRSKWAEKQNVFKRDNLQTKVLESRGYKVFRFSESEINYSIDNCLNSVINFVNQNSNARK